MEARTLDWELNPQHFDLWTNSPTTEPLQPEQDIFVFCWILLSVANLWLELMNRIVPKWVLVDIFIYCKVMWVISLLNQVILLNTETIFLFVFFFVIHSVTEKTWYTFKFFLHYLTFSPPLLKVSEINEVIN